MVEIKTADGIVQVDIRGLHKLFAFKGRLELPASAVRRLDAKQAWHLWKGLRAPGTHLPGVIAAGTFYKDGERHFWDVRNAGRAIEIELEGQRYQRLFVEVADPEATLQSLAGPQHEQSVTSA
jgi:hypothetical protein